MFMHGLNRTWLRRLALALILTASPAAAERLTFDHRLYPPLKQVLDSGDAGMINYNAKNPAYVVDLIAIKGKSASDWTEALEIVSRIPGREVNSSQTWLEQLRQQTDRLCPNALTLLEQGPTAVTFERDLTNCHAGKPAYSLTRIIAGKRSLFEVSFLFKAMPDRAVRDSAMAMLASAHLD